MTTLFMEMPEDQPGPFVLVAKRHNSISNTSRGSYPAGKGMEVCAATGEIGAGFGWAYYFQGDVTPAFFNHIDDALQALAATKNYWRSSSPDFVLTMEVIPASEWGKWGKS